MNNEQRDALSSQSACNCGARPGQRHSETCQYIADLRQFEAERIEQEAALVVRDAELIIRFAASKKD